jgi:uncharacterized protein
MRSLLAWLLLVLAFTGTAAHAALPPRPNGPILDQANIIPDAQETALVGKLETYNRATGRAVMVVTLASLDGQDIESFGSALGHAWGVGGKDTDQGLILIVAPNERKLRIEVGYGLEEYLPDVLADRIVRDVITPKFKAGDMPGGIDAGIGAILTQLNRDPADAKAVAEAAAAAQRSSREDHASIPSVIFWIVLIVFFAFMFGGRRGRRGYRRGGIDPGIVLWGASEALRGFGNHSGGFGGGGGDSGGGWGGFGGGDFGGGGASGDW